MKSFRRNTLKENLDRISGIVTEDDGMSGEKYRAEVAGRGEDTWSTNAMEYNTPEEAQEWLDNLKMRWFGYDMARVVPVSTPARERVDPSDPTIYQNFRR